MSLDLKQVKLETLSAIRYSFSLGAHPGQTHEKRVLVIRFEGAFGFGSGGNSDATFMRSMAPAELRAVLAGGVRRVEAGAVVGGGGWIGKRREPPSPQKVMSCNNAG